MGVLLAHPELPTCRDCQKWIYDPTKNWERSESREGRPNPRGRTPPPCNICPKLSKEDQHNDARPANAQELTPDNWDAYTFWMECEAGRPMPEDSIVWRNHAYLTNVEKQHARGLQGGTSQLLGNLVSLSLAKLKGK